MLETETEIFIVMEYAAGGELFDYIVAHKRVKEKEARHFFRQIVSALDYCHSVVIFIILILLETHRVCFLFFDL